jgi:signal transduction histidine kinase
MAINPRGNPRIPSEGCSGAYRCFGKVSRCGGTGGTPVLGGIDRRDGGPTHRFSCLSAVARPIPSTIPDLFLSSVSPTGVRSRITRESLARGRPTSLGRVMSTSNESPSLLNSTRSHQGAGAVVPAVEQILARVVRHEVADLLQTVYSAVAILQDRFPPDGLEQQLLGFLKGRAETCRLELDAVVDLVCPMNLRCSVVDLSSLTASLLLPLRTQFTDRQIDWTPPAAIPVEVDSTALTRSLQLLLRTSCQLAAHRLRISLNEAPPWLIWTLERDGPSLTEEQRTWLERPLSTTRSAPFGLALALANRMAACHGGDLNVESPAEGGVLLTIRLPVPETPRS